MTYSYTINMEIMSQLNFSDAKMSEERAKQLAELVSKVSLHPWMIFSSNFKVKILRHAYHPDKISA